MPDPYLRARRHLAKADPVLGLLIKKIGPCGLGRAPVRDPFAALVEAIASQQLSVKAADTIYGRFCALFPGRRPVPRLIPALTDDTLRGVGFSRAKVGFIRDLAARVNDGRLDLHGLRHAPDHEVMRQLIELKGIGRWTAEIFLIFRLNRPDVFPVDDLGLVKAVQRAYGLRTRPSEKRLLKIGEAWRPYRSVASWYLWASLSTGQEE